MDPVTTRPDETEESVTRDPLRAPEQDQPAPDVDSDRVPATDAEPEGSLDRVDATPLGIQDIENLEDDSKGG